MSDRSTSQSINYSWKREKEGGGAYQKEGTEEEPTVSGHVIQNRQWPSLFFVVVSIAHLALLWIDHRHKGLGVSITETRGKFHFPAPTPI